jgi:hypothetical protein
MVMKVMVHRKQTVVKSVTMEIMLVGMVVHLLVQSKLNMSVLMQLVTNDGVQAPALLNAATVLLTTRMLSHLIQLCSHCKCFQMEMILLRRQESWWRNVIWVHTTMVK